MSEFEETTGAQEMSQENPQESRMEFVAPAAPQTEEPEILQNEDKSNNGGNGNLIHYVLEAVLLVAVIVLFVFHFNGVGVTKDADAPVSTKVATQPGNGNILYVNMDTIYECDLFKEKQDILDAESSQLESSFTARQSKLEADAAQFEKNAKAGLLTESQMQNTYQQLGEASQKIQQDYEEAMKSLAKKQADLTSEMMDALREAANEVNASLEGNTASYVITYSNTNPTVIIVDPSRDITQSVISHLNKKCTNKSDK